MIIKLSAIAAALLASGIATAQPNRLSIGLNTLTQSRVIGDEQPFWDRTTTKTALVVLPTIGYFRTFRNKMGIGIELGYGRNRTEQRVEDPRGPLRNTVVTTSDRSMYHFCPSVFQVFDSENGRYRFIASLSLPVTITPASSVRTRTTSTDMETGVSQLIYEANYAPTRSVAAGLFLNGSVQRRIAGNLYFGPQVGVGASHTTVTEKGTTYIVHFPGQSQERRLQSETDRASKTLVFDIRPTISFNYFF